MYITEDDDSFDECWYLVRIIEQQTVYIHKVSRDHDITQFIWSQRKNKALRFLTIKGLLRFIVDYNLLDKQIFVLVEKNGRAQGIIPAGAF